MTTIPRAEHYLIEHYLLAIKDPLCEQCMFALAIKNTSALLVDL